MSDVKYKLVYQDAGWIVMKTSIVADVNPLTGAPTKNAGQEKQEAVAYPHLSTHAPSSLFRRMIPEGSTVESLQDWVDVHNNTIEIIHEELKGWMADQEKLINENTELRALLHKLQKKVAEEFG